MSAPTPPAGPPVAGPDFDALYRSDADPWSVGSSFYEQRKLALVLAALARPRYRLGWDPACGTGHLTAALAERCDRVIGTDASIEAVKVARTRCADRPQVAVEQLAAQDDPAAVITEPVDLVAISEFLYYLDEEDRATALAHATAACEPGAELISVHWRPHPHDAWLSGAAVQAQLVDRLRRDGWQPLVHLDDPDFVLDSLQRTS